DTWTYVDGNGDTQTDSNTYERTDWEACNELEYGTEEWESAWDVRVVFKNCDERIKYDYDYEAARIAEEIARAQSDGRVYEGPATPYDMPWFMGDAYTNTYIDQDGNEVVEDFPANRYGHRGQIARCKTIGDIPTSLINGGNASVVNGVVTYDPTP
ncbi:hypothetical protein N9J45_02325, partial [Gammaproteobacteria bacterium]|nr:hypothetical protein [Gammaproteobacteria bacterium]